MKPVTKAIRDASGYGIIDEVRESRLVENTSETNVAGIARQTTIGHIMLAALGTVAAPALIETGVYSHVFTRKNDNTPVTYTFTEDTPAGEQRAAYNVLDTLDIEAKAGDYVRFSAKYVGAAMTNTS